MSQFRNKAEAQQAIQDMERRCRATLARPGGCEQDAREYAEEAARIRALLPTLPE